jgi:hypothetical protein
MTLTNVEWLDEDKKSEAEPTSQAISAKEIKELYIWWTTVYQNRPEPMDASGWSEHCDAMRLKYPDNLFSSLTCRDSDDKQSSDKAHNLLQEIEAAYEKEDEEMMIRIIKIRNSLWT